MLINVCLKSNWRTKTLLTHWAVMPFKHCTITVMVPLDMAAQQRFRRKVLAADIANQTPLSAILVDHFVLLKMRLPDESLVTLVTFEGFAEFGRPVDIPDVIRKGIVPLVRFVAVCAVIVTFIVVNSLHMLTQTSYLCEYL